MSWPLEPDPVLRCYERPEGKERRHEADTESDKNSSHGAPCDKVFCSTHHIGAKLVCTLPNIITRPPGSFTGLLPEGRIDACGGELADGIGQGRDVRTNCIDIMLEVFFVRGSHR